MTQQYLPGHTASAEHAQMHYANREAAAQDYLATLQSEHTRSAMWLSETLCSAVHLHSPQVSITSTEECLVQILLKLC